MIIWQGWGLMAILIPLSVSTIPATVVSSFVPELTTPFLIIGAFIGGLLVYLLGKKLHDPRTNDIILYDEQGQSYRFKKHIDTLFWIPIEYCGILTSIGALIIFVNWLINPS